MIDAVSTLSGHVSDKAGLWQAVADHFGVTRVAKKGRICSDGHRSPQVVLVKGEDPWVTHVDNKIKSVALSM